MRASAARPQVAQYGEASAPPPLDGVAAQAEP
jgi:hypothetical protein